MPTQTTASPALEVQKEQHAWTNYNHQVEGYILLHLSLQVLWTVTGKDTMKGSMGQTYQGLWHSWPLTDLCGFLQGYHLQNLRL